MISVLFAAGLIAVPNVGPAIAKRIHSVVEAPSRPSDPDVSINIQLFADPNGKVLDCEILAITGRARNGKAVCRAALNAKITPATGADGKPTFGVVNFNIFVVEQYPSDALRKANATRPAGLPDIIVPLAAEDLVGAQSVQSTLLVEVGPDGKVLECGQPRNAVAGLDLIGCPKAMQAKMPVRTSKTGEPVKYVTTMVVNFTVGSE